MSNKRTKKKYKKKISKQSRTQSRLIKFVVLVVLVSVCFSGYKMHKTSKRYEAIEAELDAQIAEAEAEAERLKEQREYMETDAYKEEMARKKLGMIKKGEYLLKPK